MKKPDYFIVGAPKCGTSAMDRYLNQHPDIFVPKGITTYRERHFFGTDLSFNLPRPTKEKYLSFFLAPRKDMTVGDTNVWYLYSKNAATEIKELLPFAKIIIMLRNPVDMLYSLHSEFLYNGDETIESFEAALDAEHDRKRGLRIPYCQSPVEGLFYREVAKYTEQVKRYLDTFGEENVHIIIFDDFKGDTAIVYRKTLCFLGVNPVFQPKLDVFNPNKTVRSKKLRDFLRNPPQIISRPTRLLVPQLFRDKLLQSFGNWNRKNVPRQPMDPELRMHLQSEFAHEVERLSALLGRDLSHWGKD